MAIPIKPNITEKANFASRPSVPANQKQNATEFNLLVTSVRANYDRLILYWSSDVSVNQSLEVGQYVLYTDDTIYRIITGYNVGSPATWDPTKAEVLITGAVDSHFKGAYASEAALDLAHPTADDGDYAIVDVGAADAALYIWDETDSAWVASGITTVVPDGNETTKGIWEGSTQAETNTGTDDTRVVTPLKIKNLDRSVVALVDGGTIDLTGPKHTLTSSAATRTFTISHTGDEIILEVTLNTSTAVYTFPAAALCVVEGVYSGDNTATLTGVSGDKYVLAIKKVGSVYYVASKNFGQ